MPDSYKRHTGSRKEARGNASKQPSKARLNANDHVRRFLDAFRPRKKTPKRCNKENNDPHHHEEYVKRRFRPTKAVVLAAADSDEPCGINLQGFCRRWYKTSNCGSPEQPYHNTYNH